jgi:hypothetical protein
MEKPQVPSAAEAALYERNASGRPILCCPEKKYRSVTYSVTIISSSDIFSTEDLL